MSEEASEQMTNTGPADPPVGTSRTRLVWSWIGLVAGVLAVLGLALAVYGPTPIVIDGSLTVVARGTSIASLRGQGMLIGPRGDLVSIHGRVLKSGEGGESTVLVDGAAAATLAPLPSGARITNVRGPSVTEPTVRRTVETTPAVRYRGTGPSVSVEDSGTPGTAVEVVGAVSGEELSRAVVSAGYPMTIRREPAWPGRKEVALTFDDGPWRNSTDEVLAELKAAGVKATFFMIGRQVSNRPVTARHVVAAGMEIGDHTQNHKLLAHAPHKTVTNEIAHGGATIQRLLGVKPRWFRPPGGSVSGFVRSEAKRLGYRVMLWSIDPKDWSRPGTRLISQRILDRVRPGSVILMHDGGGDRSETVAALKVVLHGLIARGYTMVTLSQLYHLPGQKTPTLLNKVTGLAATP
jgi:peptidoglycan/xylan/chitin deacetylase (PgdA/CDA1 family)